MKGWKTFLSFGAIGALGLVTALQGIDVKSFLLPLVCQVPENAQIVADECTGKIISLVGYWTSGLSALAIFLRAVTTSPIFKNLVE